MTGPHNKKLWLIVLVSLGIKLLLMPFFLEEKPPHLPYFDVWVYLLGAKCILAGGTLYSGSTGDVCFSLYGPSLSMLMALALKVFGENYLLKLPSILFETLAIMVFFNIGRRLFGAGTALFFTFVYSFSYLPLYLTGMTGNDDPIFMFFVLLATFFLFREEYTPSAISLAIASSFKVTPILFLPAFFIAICSKAGLKKTFAFLLTFGVVLSAFILPFYAAIGNRMLYLYSGNAAPDIATSQTPAHLSPLNLIRMMHRVVAYVLDPSVSNQDAFMYLLNTRIVPLATVAGLLLAGVYMLANRLEDTRLEFLRNASVTVILALLTSSLATPDYVSWFFPFLLLFLGVVYSKRYRSGMILGKERIGAVLTILGIFAYALFFKYSYYTVLANTYLVWLVFILSAPGAYLMFCRLPKMDRLLWTGVTLAISMFGVSATNPLLVLQPILEKVLPASLVTREVVVVSESGGMVASPFMVDLLYLPYLLSSIIIFITSISLLGFRLHNLGNQYGGVKKWRIRKIVQGLGKRRLSRI